MQSHKTLNEQHAQREIQTLTTIQHFLVRPEVYMAVGGERLSKLLYRNGKLTVEMIEIDNKFLHVFKEVVANAIDANPSGTVNIKLTVEEFVNEQGFSRKRVRTIVRNTGAYMLPGDLVRCFFEFLTGSNFGTEIGGIGRNGIGAKVVPLVSEYFKVTTFNPTCTAFTEVRNYAQHQVVPTVTTIPANNIQTGAEVEWTFDLTKIHVGTNIAMYESSAVEFSMGQNVSISFNGLMYPKLWNNLPQLLGLTHFHFVKESHMQYYIFDHMDNPNIQSFSIINGLYALSNGYHHNKYVRELGDVLRNKFPALARNLTNESIKAKFTFLYNFHDTGIQQNGQEKTKVQSMTIPLAHVEVPLSISKWPSMQNIQVAVRNEKLNSIRKVTDFDNTYYVPPTTAARDILLIGEGDSTRGYLNRMREMYGVHKTGLYVLKGKPRNCIEAEADSVIGNKTIVGLMSALNVTLLSDANASYNKIIIAADADDDGLHIVTLVYTIFVEYWSNLLDRLYILGSFVTRGYINGNIVDRSLKEVPPTANYEVRYFKGLGSCNKLEIEDDFINAPLYKLKVTENDIADFRAVMRSGGTTVRKHVALSEGSPEYYTPRTPKSIHTVHDELPMSLLWQHYYRTYILRSIVRALPSSDDGIKDSLRKILYTVLVSKETNYKVEVLANTASKVCDYHHGAKSLSDAIVRLCRNYHTQIPMLTGQGQFGTIAGNDCAAPRYLNASVPTYLKALFPFKCTTQERLVCLLPYPMINGMSGIASGWQTNIPKIDLQYLFWNLFMFLENPFHTFMYPEVTEYRGRITSNAQGITIEEPPWGATFANVKAYLETKKVHALTLEGGRLFIGDHSAAKYVEDAITETAGRNYVFHTDSKVRVFTASLYGQFHAAAVLEEYRKLDEIERKLNAQEIIKYDQILKYCQISNGVRFQSKAELLEFTRKHEIDFANIKNITDLDKTAEGVAHFQAKRNALNIKFPTPEVRYINGLRNLMNHLTVLPEWKNLSSKIDAVAQAPQPQQTGKR